MGSANGAKKRHSFHTDIGALNHRRPTRGIAASGSDHRGRPRITWPDGARIAVWVVPDTPRGRHSPGHSRLPPTPDPPAEAGFGWCADRINDDMAFAMTTRAWPPRAARAVPDAAPWVVVQAHRHRALCGLPDALMELRPVLLTGEMSAQGNRLKVTERFW